MITLTVFEIFLFEGRSVLGPAQRGAGSERVKFLVKRTKNSSAFVGIAWKVLVLQAEKVLNGFQFLWFCLTLSILEKLIPETLDISN